MPSSFYQVSLEKKSRGRTFSSILASWATRTVILRYQVMEYFNGSELKGSIFIGGATVALVPPEEADGRQFAFSVDNGSEKVLLSAPNAEIRDITIEILKRATIRYAWETVEEETIRLLKHKGTETADGSSEREELLDRQKHIEALQEELEAERRRLAYEYQHLSQQKSHYLSLVEAVEEKEKFESDRVTWQWISFLPDLVLPCNNSGDAVGRFQLTANYILRVDLYCTGRNHSLQKLFRLSCIDEVSANASAAVRSAIMSEYYPTVCLPSLDTLNLGLQVFFGSWAINIEEEVVYNLCLWLNSSQRLDDY
jgi:hypothetical protein